MSGRRPFLQEPVSSIREKVVIGPELAPIKERNSRDLKKQVLWLYGGFAP